MKKIDEIIEKLSKHGFEKCSCSKFCCGDILSEEKGNGYISDFKEHDSKVAEEMKSEIRKLKSEIERLRKKCGEVPCEECDSEYDDELDTEALLIELQDQHQQDCIRYTEMRMAFLKAVDELAMLRKQFGLGW